MYINHVFCIMANWYLPSLSEMVTRRAQFPEASGSETTAMNSSKLSATLSSVIAILRGASLSPALNITATSPPVKSETKRIQSHVCEISKAIA